MTVEPMAGSGQPIFVRRFDRYNRLLHGFLMLSFLGLAFTGMPLLFSHEAWAARLARLFGGFGSAGILHRLFALTMIAVFVLHLVRIGRRVFQGKDLSMLWGPSSMVPQPRDLLEMVGHIRWFVGAGPRPKFDDFTYWEKFDYWAVFWGMAIIGGSGMLLWMPEFFAHLLPGWVFNIAMIVHGEEALLAVGFIFTIHFFNGHLRPEKFPMDTVIFSGRVTLDELQHERPDQYARLIREGRLDEHVIGDAPAWVHTLGRVVGTLAVLFGLTMVGLILYAVQ
ncbi:MAG: cytochrome b/b6 domain-containing protein [Acidobacteriota bacterium]